MTKLQIPTPRWALPLLDHSRYKGAKGGRGSGKSHFFADLLIDEHVRNKDMQSVCVREIQKSLKFSAKKLIESKIRDFKVSHLFDITLSEIRRIDGEGIIIFQGLQDHTADSIKSLEGFDRAWVEEGQSISSKSMEMLLPTIRAPGSEIWFSWNPDQETDPVEKMLGRDNMTSVHVNYLDNPFCPAEVMDEANQCKLYNSDRYGHIWLGEYNVKSDRIVFNGKYRVDEFIPTDDWSGPYFGLDFGFSQDPTAAIKCWIKGNTLFIEHDAGKIGLELDETTEYLKPKLPGIDKHVIRADSARPESISYLKRKGLPKITGAKKGPGSVEDGVEFIKSFDEVIIHPRCQNALDEFRTYSYKIDKQSGDIMPKLEDSNNHYIDALRYALEEVRRNRKRGKLALSGERKSEIR